MDDHLQSRAEVIAESIDTYWETRKLDTIKHGEKLDITSEETNMEFTKMAQDWVEETSKDPKLTGIIIQIFDAHRKKLLLQRIYQK